MKSEPSGSNVTLFTHQDGKKFEVTIVRLDEAVDLVDADNMRSYREEDWDSDDWDEDAEDWAEPTPLLLQQQPQPPLRLHRVATTEDWADRTESRAREEERRPEARGRDQVESRKIANWDGDAEDLEERPVAKWSERPERPDWARRRRDTDVWRTRLGED